MPEALLVKSMSAGSRVMKVEFRDSVELPKAPACEYLGPGLPMSDDVARLWDKIILTDDEDRVIQAVNLMTDEDIVQIAVVGNGAGSGRATDGRRMLARLRSHGRPVPLKSLGDGAVRTFGVATALASSKDGFLLINEAENSIHHAVQRDFWRMVLQTAEDNNVQVLATTHGWDCVRGFAQATVDLDAIDGALVRLERRDGHTRAVDYSQDALAIAAREGIEVR